MKKKIKVGSLRCGTTNTIFLCNDLPFFLCYKISCLNCSQKEVNLKNYLINSKDRSVVSTNKTSLADLLLYNFFLSKQ